MRIEVDFSRRNTFRRRNNLHLLAVQLRRKFLQVYTDAGSRRLERLVVYVAFAFELPRIVIDTAIVSDLGRLLLRKNPRLILCTYVGCLNLL